MLTISAICNWADTNPKKRNFVEGERLLRAGHIFKCGKNGESDSGVISFTSYCLKTSKLRDHPHQINGKISINGEILSVVCSCKAGLGEQCKHILATLLYCNRNDIETEELSCTDKECKWKKSYQKALDNYIPRPLLEHDCFLSKTRKNFICSKEDEDDIRNIVLRNLPSSAFSKQEFGRHNPVLKKSKKEDDRAINRSAIQIIFKEQDNNLMNMINEIQTPTLRECCLEKIKNLDKKGVQICKETLKSYTEWQRQRQYRITGTTCYNLFTYTKNKNPDWEKKCNRFFDISNFKSQYTDYGKEKEKEALQEFTKNTGNNIVETDLIICQKNPWLAYSPDGIIMKDGKPDILVEIKCPFRGKDKNIEDAIRFEFGKCLHFAEKEIVLRKNHKYYGQIQLGMAVINVKKTFFIVYASFDKSYIVIETLRDSDFIFTMLRSLKILYFNIIIHKICEKSMSDSAKENKDSNNV